MTEFTDTVVDIIKSIPKGKVATYGQVAALAGSPRASRQVVRILHTQTKKHGLPWHRLINSKGQIAIKDAFGADEQKARLNAEGVEVDDKYKINLKNFQWQP
ncbi:MAG: MGMT family protein [Candidatus Heimdallarchaeota archaeon]|nr:MGMT family protein [Candidatus Heimdallarchaeota archaeon]